MILSGEASIAILISKRHDFNPGDSLENLIAPYADVEYMRFPFDNVDGISLNLKSSVPRPNIIINSSIPATRAKFTLAHEFGHVLIPWHSGMVFSSIDKYSRSTNAAYREIEAEANRFAAELLLPSGWLQALHVELGSPTKVVKHALKICGTSIAATIIAVNNSLPAGYVFACTDNDDFVLSSSATRGTYAAPFDKGELLTDTPTYEECEQCYTYEHKGYKYNWLAFETEKKINVSADERAWRVILDEIVADVDPDISQSNLKASINAIISASNTRSANAEAFFATVRQKFAGKGVLYQKALSHPQFNIFLSKKIDEFLERRSRI